MNCFQAQEQIGRHESESFKSLVRHGAPLGLTFASRNDQTFNADDVARLEFLECVLEPIGKRLAIIVDERNDSAAGGLSARGPRDTRPSNMGMYVENVGVKWVLPLRQGVCALIDDDDFEIRRHLPAQLTH